MNLLIAVKSSIAELQAGKNQNIRESWYKAAQGRATVMFFNGDPFEDYGRNFIQRVKDEIHLPNVKDTTDPYSDALKVRGIFRWMLGKTFTHVLLVDTATYIDVDKLLKLKLEKLDYAGVVKLGDVEKGETFQYATPSGAYFPKAHAWAAADRGIWLSRDAVDELSENAMLEPFDFRIGQTLGTPIFRAHLKAAEADLPTWHMPGVKFGPIYDAGGPEPIIDDALKQIVEKVEKKQTLDELALEITPTVITRVGVEVPAHQENYPKPNAENVEAFITDPAHQEVFELEPDWSEKIGEKTVDSVAVWTNAGREKPEVILEEKENAVEGNDEVASDGPTAGEAVDGTLDESVASGQGTKV